MKSRPAVANERRLMPEVMAMTKPISAIINIQNEPPVSRLNAFMLLAT